MSDDLIEQASQQVAETAAALNEALAAHQASGTAQAVADAQSAHEEAKRIHAELTAEPDPVVGEHILVDLFATGAYVKRDLPADAKRAFPAAGYPRQLYLDGVNVEQVGEEKGVRLYRRM